MGCVSAAVLGSVGAAFVVRVVVAEKSILTSRGQYRGGCGRYVGVVLEHGSELSSGVLFLLYPYRS